LTNYIISTGKFPENHRDFGTASSIVVKLNTVFAEFAEMNQNNNKLHRVLSKVYRIFVELMWFQCQLNGVTPTYSKTKQDIIQLSDKMISGLGKDEIQAKFNYRCAQEAAKHLNPPTQEIIQKYMGDLFALAGAIADNSIPAFISAFFQLAQDIDQDWARDWYKDVHCMNWMIIPLKTIPSLEIDIISTIDGFKWGNKELRTKDRQYTICLAIISTKFIQHPNADQALKHKSHELLNTLLRLKEKGLKSKMLTSIAQQTNHTPNIIITIAESQDKFFKTRRFAEQCLAKIYNNPNYSPEHNEQIGLIKPQNNPPLKKTIKDKKSTLKKEKEEIKSEKDKIILKLKIEEEKLNVRGGESIDTEETMKLKAEFGTKSAKEQQIKDMYQQLRLLEEWIPDIDTEETQYLQEILR